MILSKLNWHTLIHATGIWLLTLIVNTLSVSAAQAQNALPCSSFGGVLDGFAGDVPPATIEIDQNCTIRNYPDGMSTNFNFFTQPGQVDERWLIVFDNVFHTGQMSCNAVLEHKIWFVNGSSSTIQENCQNLLIPVEKIDKTVEDGQTTAAIGVPFTYLLTSPVLFDPGGSVVIDDQGSPNDLHGVTLIDDLNELGVDVTLLGYTAYWKDSGAPIAHTFSDVNGLLTWDNFPIIPAGEQFIIELTLVLDDTLANAPGTEFTNIARWDFGRFIDGTYFEPLPGEWGISPPLTIAAPELVVTKTGPADLGLTLNLGEWGDFGIDVLNTGLTDAFDVTIVDLLPDGQSGGMCNANPEILGAQVFEADGTTPVPGKGPLSPGVDFTVDYQGVPNCQLTLEFLTSAAVIGPGERLVIDYRTQLDSDTSEGALLTNVVGAVSWFNGDTSVSDRVEFVRALSDGTPGVDDHEDEHTVQAMLLGYFFEKTVANLTSGANPTATAAPGDVLRYTLRLQTTDGALADFTFFDDLGALNTGVVFEPGSMVLVPGTLPPGATDNSDPNAGTNGAGLIDIDFTSLAAQSEVSIQFDITVATGLPDSTTLTNQSELLATGGVSLVDSDDPNVNGQSDPNVSGDEDPTVVLVQGPPPTGLSKANTQATATIGETFSYLVTVPAVPHISPIYDVRILDNLAASAADLELVSVDRVSGVGNWTPENTGTATDLVIEDPVNGIDIPAGRQAVIEITVRLADTSTNVAGLQFTNTAAYTYNLADDDPASELQGEPATTQPMTIVEPELTLEKNGPANLRVGTPGTFTLDIHNTGTSPAFGVFVTDVLPNQADGGMCDAPPAQVRAQLFEADGTTPVVNALVAGADYVVTFSGDPVCTFTLELLTPAAAILPDQRLLITYEAELDADTQRNVELTNIAGATEWFGLDISDTDLLPYARTYSRVLTDGTVGVLDHEDAHTLVEFTPLLIFEKTAVNMTSGEDPATVATPGDTLRYRLRIENAGDTPVPSFDIRDELDRLNPQPLFQGGTLTLVSVPSGADSSNSSSTGGGAGTGLLDVRDLSLGGLGDSLAIEFEVALLPVIADGTIVYNQSEFIFDGNPVALSDDPNVNGTADPDVAGDEDPTQILIESAPEFLIEKVSSYLDGDPAVLLADERLRYTITVQNVGTEHATSVQIIDQVPVSTSYVAGSTTLNGIAVADGPSGASPLANGILVNAPGDATPGNMSAAAPDNVATIVFDVLVDADVVDGTVISNQAFVSAPDNGLADLPSDDPRTELADDPTRDVVGNFPLLFASKSAALQVDGGSPGIVDPGDVLRYTITVYNNGSVPATVVELVDQLPADTIYVEDSTTLNGEPVGQPDGGTFPLEAGIPVSSADLTPPVPADGEGVLSPGESGVVQFDLEVEANVVPGTLITNQAVVHSEELPDLLTDGDGDPSTGPEPTVVVVGDVQQVSIVKAVAVVGGGSVLAGSTLEYTVTVRNIGTVPAHFVTIYDDLAVPNPGYLAYIDQSATLNGLPDGVAVSGTLITADFFNEYGPLAAGETAVLRFRATIDSSLADGTTVTNTAEVQWNDPLETATASVSISIGGTPGVGILNGSVWHDADFDDVLDGVERVLEGWRVELYQNGAVVHSTLTDVDGVYRIAGVAPTTTIQDQYELRFTAPGAGASTAALGRAFSVDFVNGMQQISEIAVPSGANLQNLDLPIDPNGTVYNATSRAPIAGAILTMLDAATATPLPSTCFDDPAQQDQITLPYGYYKFDVNFSDPACAEDGAYLIRVTPPSAAYIDGESAMMPPATGSTTGPLSVPGCLQGGAADAVPTTTLFCEATTSEFTPPTSVAAGSADTVYYLHLTLDDSSNPGSRQIFNNHIPLDPDLADAIAISKTSPELSVTRGQLVPYIITVSNDIGFDLTNVSIVDRFPTGFRYVEGSARIDGVPSEPTVTGSELVWDGLVITGAGRHRIDLLFAVGAGVSEGEFVNRAQVINNLTGSSMSSEASATVRLVPDPDFDCTDVMGKVFDDYNRNGMQDNDEPGLGGVRLVSTTGLAATTDSEGRYHITCAIVPNENRGSNFVLKLDDRTLPSGFRASMQPLQIARATRGKALRMNFGASIHRVVGLDLADPVFEPNGIELRPQWGSRLDLLLDQLQTAPAVLRLTYLADVENAQLVENRLDALEHEIESMWLAEDRDYELEIEAEVFWRLGGPPDLPDDVVGGGE